MGTRGPGGAPRGLPSRRLEQFREQAGGSLVRFDVELGEACLQEAVGAAYGVVAVEASLEVHDAAVGLLGMRVEDHRPVEVGERTIGIVGFGDLGELREGVDRTTTYGLAFRFDPCVVTAFQKLAAVGVDGAFERGGAFLVTNGAGRVVESGVETPQVGVDGNGVEPVPTVAVNDEHGLKIGRAHV